MITIINTLVKLYNKTHKEKIDIYEVQDVSDIFINLDNVLESYPFDDDIVIQKGKLNMRYLTLDEIIIGMNINRREHNIRASKRELRRRGYTANYDAYKNQWYLS